MEHSFTAKIKEILQQHFGKNADEIFKASELLTYINNKTASAGKGSKSRSSFANLYAIYVLVEDYLKQGYDGKGGYSDEYGGAIFIDLFNRQRKLPFGGSLQNHALNNRMNGEFEKFFPNSEYIPILRNQETNKYWINENLLKIRLNNKTYNIGKPIIAIIDQYIQTKQDSFQRFIKQCEELQQMEEKDSQTVKDFIISLLAPNVDARLFEIVSYGILKYYYQDKVIIWGYSMEELREDNLILYKTGRTNANDGGIDFVMKPLGTFFQVTETTDFKKYFLDIDKVQKYPITFVIKSTETEEDLYAKIKGNAKKVYAIEQIVDKYMNCIEEVINIDKLKGYFIDAVEAKHLKKILAEIILQSKVEFNIDDEEE